jgi:hypothetical protein
MFVFLETNGMLDDAHNLAALKTQADKLRLSLSGASL